MSAEPGPVYKPRSIRSSQGSRGTRVDQNTTRIFIADDHPLVRGALRQAVSGAVAQADIVECGDLDALSAELEKNSDADLIMLDLSMPGVRGFSGLMYLRAQYPLSLIHI